MRADKKKQKGLADAVRRCRSKKKHVKEGTQNNEEASAPSLYDNLMRVVILAVCYF